MPNSQSSTQLLPKPALTSSQYIQLLQKLKKQILDGQTKIERYVERQKVLTNWKVGRMIAVDLLRNQTKAPMGDHLLERLARDLNTTERFLQQTAQFYRAYPQLDQKKPLSWTHYRRLLTVNDPKERLAIELKVIREGMSVDNLAMLLVERRQRLSGTIEPPPAKTQRGNLYHYLMIKITHLNADDNQLMVDAGFDIHLEAPPHAAQLKAGFKVASVKINEAYSLKIDDVPGEALYTYKAYVERVIDGDTMIVHVDVGFGIWTRQILRLRGLDCPEMSTEAGQASRRWLTARLDACPFVIIKTYKSDKYDRYLVDIFYLPKEEDRFKVTAQGRLLNQDLLEAGLAERWN